MRDKLDLKPKWEVYTKANGTLLYTLDELPFIIMPSKTQLKPPYKMSYVITKDRLFVAL